MTGAFFHFLENETKNTKVNWPKTHKKLTKITMFYIENQRKKACLKLYFCRKNIKKNEKNAPKLSFYRGQF